MSVTHRATDVRDVSPGGHTLGGGITPLLTQRAVARGWGGTGLWRVPLAPFSAPTSL